MNVRAFDDARTCVFRRFALLKIVNCYPFDAFI